MVQDKIVYFIRHGEFDGNFGPVRLGQDSSLNARGVSQAKKMAQRVAKLEFEAAVVSPYARTKETAEIILKGLPVKVEFSDLFKERRRPSVMVNAVKTDPESIKAEEEVWRHWHDTAWHHSDEENFVDLKKRAAAALSFLEKHRARHLLVVTHGFFMRILIGYAICVQRLDTHIAKDFIRGFDHENTGLTVLRYNSKIKPPGWHIWVWNDHAHLG